MDQIIDWLYGKLIGFFADFFSQIGNMGVELFELEWVQNIVLFFSYLAWALFVVGLVVAVFELAIEYQNGRGNIKDASLHVIKGFMATSLFTVVPVRLYELSVELQNTLIRGLTGYDSTIGELANGVIGSLGAVPDLSMPGFGGLSTVTNPLFVIFLIVMLGYAVIKVFFANIKRGGILLIQIAVGSLYMFSVPRGYDDGFIQWCKQIIALCLTSFLQVTILTAGLMMIKDNALLGLGLMLAAGEIPRIAGIFGMDTSTKGNLVGAVHTASMAVNMTKTITQVVAK